MKSFCRDPYQLVIIDSNCGSNNEDSEYKKEFCKKYNIELKILPNELNSGYVESVCNASLILGNKLNYVYNEIIKYESPTYFAFLDQDFFSFSEFSIIPDLDENGMYGDVMYRGTDKAWVLHPWLSFYKFDFVKDYSLDFRPCSGFDTGGSNWEVFIKRKNLAPDVYDTRDKTIMYFPFYESGGGGPVGYEKEYFTYNGKLIYGQCQIYDGKFIHMLNSSKLSDPFHPKTSWAKGFLDASILLGKKLPFTLEEGFVNKGPAKSL